MATEPTSPPTGKKFPCVKCGARIEFDPKARSLKCPYCGHVEAINPEKGDEIVQHDLDAYLSRTDQATVLPGRTSQVKCNVCGAVVLLEDKVAADKCPYCASFIENKPEAAEAMLPPECMLPFKIENKQAVEKFTTWLRSLWFAPARLRISPTSAGSPAFTSPSGPSTR